MSTTPPASFDIQQMRQAAGDACSLMKTLGNQDRLLLLCQMLKGEQCVSQLEQSLGILQPTLSQQLAVLRNEGFVDTRREGKQIFYSLASDEVRQLLQLLHQLYCR